MALDTRLPLLAQGSDIFAGAQRGIGLGQQIQAERRTQEAFPLLQAGREQNLAIGEQNLATGALQQEAAGIGIENARQLQSINQAKGLSAMLDQLQSIPNPADRIKAIQGMRQGVEALGVNFDQLVGGFDATDQGLIEARQDLAPILALAPRQGGGLASAKTEFFEDGSSIQGLPSGETVAKDPQGRVVTGQARQDLFARSAKFGLDVKREEADIAIDRAQRTAAATQRESRISNMKKDFGDRNRGAARGQVRLRQALRVAGRAEQGVAGSAKLQLAKLFPSIDVTDEALLDQTLGQLTIDELQKFKGPTTDFEFEKAQRTVGAVGDSKTANIARLKSLERAGWFQKREAEQFNAHVKSGGDPDTWAFNFGEPVRTKKGLFTLQDLQDTAVDNNLSIEEVLERLNK